MNQISFAIPPAPQSDWLFRWQMAINTAFASGSLTTALFNLGVLIALSLVRSALSRFAPARLELHSDSNNRIAWKSSVLFDHSNPDYRKLPAL